MINILQLYMEPLVWFSTIILATLVINKLISLLLAKVIFRRARHSADEIDEHMLAALIKPVSLIVIASGVYLAFRYLPISENVIIVFAKLYRSLFIIAITWALYNLCGNHSVFADEMKHYYRIDNDIIAFFSKTLRLLVLAFALVIIAKEWGYDVNGFVAGLGLGGLAFALAAKDAIANIFGGVVIIMEKPFKIGDLISTPSAEGFVTDITFRSTRVRSFTEAVVTVPNSTLANEPITNYSSSGKRHITYTISISTKTPRPVLENCINEIKKMLSSHPQLEPNKMLVTLDSFNHNNYNLLINCYSLSDSWIEHKAINEDINFRLLAILDNFDLIIGD